MIRPPSASLGEISLGSLSLEHSDTGSSTNLTIGFYEANYACADGAGAPAGAIRLITESYTKIPVCYNIDEIFASSNGSDWTRPPTNVVDLPAYQYGVNWTLSNNDLLFRKDGNYSGVFIESTRSFKLPSDQTGPGKPNERRIQIYEERDCSSIVLGQGSTQAPFYEISCSTPDGGECHRAKSSFKSFRFTPADAFDQPGQCKAYYQPNSAASISAKTSMLIAGLTSIAAIWLAL
jgi:hypothetical protein